MSVCEPGACTKRSPCCEISQAFAGIADAAGAYHIVEVAPGTYTQKVALTTTDKQVAVLGQVGVMLNVPAVDNEVIILLGDNTAPFVPLASKLYLSRLEIRGSGAVGISCNDAVFLGVDEVTIRDLASIDPLKGSSLFTSKCTMQARRSQFLGNYGGLRAAAGTARLVNTIIAGTKKTPALQIDQEGELNIIYSTIALPDELAGGLLSCPLKNEKLPGTVTIRNSALLAGSDTGQVSCTGKYIDASNTVTTDATIFTGLNNLMVSPTEAASQFLFKNWVKSDLHLVGDGGILKDIARWKTGDPATDIDGLPRPVVDDSLDVAGADLPGP